MNQIEEWLTVQEVADKLRVKAFTVRRAIRSGKLKAARIGGQSGYRISPQAVKEYMEERSKAPAA